MNSLIVGDTVVPTKDIDVTELPSYAFGHRSIMWWGTLGMMAIEGTVFALAIGAYLFLRTRVEQWPPSGLPPALVWGVSNTVVMIISLVPNHFTKVAAEQHNLAKVRRGLGICLLFAVACLVVRGFEFAALNCYWDDNAYASATWTLLGLHTTHLITDVFDTAVLTVLVFKGPIEGRRFVDVAENAFYWNFVVAAWIPISAIIYLAPRTL
jgi:cytochrome c oxidase subunit 3